MHGTYGRAAVCVSSFVRRGLTKGATETLIRSTLPAIMILPLAIFVAPGGVALKPPYRLLSPDSAFRPAAVEQVSANPASVDPFEKAEIGEFLQHQVRTAQAHVQGSSRSGGIPQPVQHQQNRFGHVIENPGRPIVLMRPISRTCLRDRVVAQAGCEVRRRRCRSFRGRSGEHAPSARARSPQSRGGL